MLTYLQELRKAGLPASDVAAAGASPKELKQGLYSAAQIAEIGLGAAELRALGFGAKDLRAAGFCAMELSTLGLSREELREAFVRYPVLRHAPAMGTTKKSSRNALHAEAEATFSALDLNGDGLISLEELQQHFSGAEGTTYSSTAVESIFAVLDRNGDGSVTPSEFRGGYVRYRAMRLALGLRSKAGVEVHEIQM